MKLQKINKVLLFRYIKIWNPNAKFESYINLFSLLITTLCTSLIIIIVSVNNGFKNNIINILDDIAGTARIYNYKYEFLSNDDFTSIIDHSDSFLKLSRFVTKECILKNSNISEGILLHSFNKDDPMKEIIQKYINVGEYTDSTIVIGKLLFDRYNFKINDEVSLLSFNKKGLDSIKKCRISGMFITNIPDYDSHLVFGSNNLFKDFIFKEDIKYNYFQINNIEESYSNEYISNNYILLDSSEINNSFYYWLNSYDNPIKLLIIFLYIISMLNIINNNYYLVYYKKNQINILFVLGMSKLSLKLIIVIRSIILSVLSCFMGILLSYTILIIENYFHIINLPAYVYFIDHLPIEINYYFILLVFPYIFGVAFISSLVNYNLINK